MTLQDKDTIDNSNKELFIFIYGYEMCDSDMTMVMDSVIHRLQDTCILSIHMQSILPCDCESRVLV